MPINLPDDDSHTSFLASRPQLQSVLGALVTGYPSRSDMCREYLWLQILLMTLRSIMSPKFTNRDVFLHSHLLNKTGVESIRTQEFRVLILLFCWFQYNSSTLSLYSIYIKSHVKSNLTVSWVKRFASRFERLERAMIWLVDGEMNATYMEQVGKYISIMSMCMPPNMFCL